MSKRDTMIRALCKSLGDDYRVTTIDLERVIKGTFGCDIYMKYANIDDLKIMFPNATKEIFKREEKGNFISLVWRYNDRMHHRKNS